MSRAALYHDRESIQPRAFALRHLIIQEVKFRKHAPLGDAERARLDRIARGVDVDYDATAHAFVVRCEGVEVRRLPFDALTLFQRGDGAAAVQDRATDTRHWDTALERNRALVRDLVTAMASRLAAAP